MISETSVGSGNGVDRTNKENRRSQTQGNFTNVDSSQNSQRSAQAALQISQAELEAALCPQTPDRFKNTFRHSLRRRTSHLTRPLIIITFQGVLGDFFKGDGISTRQEQIMSKA